MRSAPSYNNKNHLLVTNMTGTQNVCLLQGLGCGLQPLSLASSPCTDALLAGKTKLKQLEDCQGLP